MGDDEQLSLAAHRYETKMKLFEATFGYLKSHFYFETSLPGPNDDAEMEMKDNQLLEAAREYVNAHEEKDNGTTAS